MNRLTNLYNVIVSFLTGLFQAIEYLSRDETRRAIDEHAVTVSRAAVRLAEFHRRNGHLVADAASSIHSAINSVEKVRDTLLADLVIIGEKGKKNEAALDKDMEKIFNSSKPTVKETKPAKHRGRPKQCSTPGCKAPRLYCDGVEFADVCAACFNDDFPKLDEEARAAEEFGKKFDHLTVASSIDNGW